jgi:hypothetical protein
MRLFRSWEVSIGAAVRGLGPFNGPKSESESSDEPTERAIIKTAIQPIHFTFATVRHRTIRSKGCLSNKTGLAMIFKLAQAAEKHWRRLGGQNQLPRVILG